MRIGIYIRVSTQEQNKNGYSISEQQDRLIKYCEAKGWTVIRVYTDGGYSGANTDRPALQDLIRDAKEGRFDAVLVYKLDRLSRSQRDTLELIEEVFLPSGVDFVSMTENFDTSTPFGMAMVGLLSVFAQLERAQTRERVLVGLEGRAKDGKWHGSKYTPVGYDYKNGELVINEYEAMLVREAYEQFNNRVPIYRICKEFREKGFKHHYGYWSVSPLKKVLQNKVYLGYINHGDEVYKGKHDPIIDEETFERAQRIFEERDKANPNHKNAFKYTSALAGLLECKHCGARYCKQPGRMKVNGIRTNHYKCYSRSKKTKALIKDPNCMNKIWNMDVLDELIFKEVNKLGVDPSYVERIMSMNDNEIDHERIETINARIEEISEQISRFTDLYSIGQLDINEIKQKIEPLTSERDLLRKELDTMNNVSSATVEETYEIAQSFGEILEKGDLDEIRFVLDELIEKIVLDDENITIHWTFA